jgi:hypothetical protein
MIRTLYEPGYKLKENEYLLKIRKDEEDEDDYVPAGFLAKLNKDGSLQKSFVEWGGSYMRPSELPIYVFEEKFRNGWKLHDWRFGQSQNWATLVHPEGFTVEIYLKQFLDIVKTHEIVRGEIVGSFMWEKNKLIWP